MLCPHDCRVNRTAGEVGVCGADAVMRVSRAGLHLWEEPPISGTVGSGTVFFSNCNLKCCYCQNAAISRGGAGRKASVEDVAGMFLDLQAQGAMNINLVTPTHYAILVRESIQVARGQRLVLPVVWNTGGYEKPETISDNKGLVDVYLTDFKYYDDSVGRSYSGVRDYREFAVAALDEMVATTGGFEYDDFGGVERMTRGVIVRHMLLPGALDDSKAVLRLLRQRYGSDIRVSIMNQYTPVVATAAKEGDEYAKNVLGRFPQLARPVASEDYERLLDYADAIGLEDYFWQEGETALESFIPDWDE